MLLSFVFVYLLVSIGIGLYAARQVKTSADYVVAGRHLPIYITIATVFATWFGSETVLGIPATFMEDGMGGIVSDPFGSSLCLIIVGLFFAAPLYRMKLLTIGDFYRRKYGRTVEIFVSLAICISYMGWVSAQIVALGLVFHMLSDGLVSQSAGMMIGMGIVLIYTLFGGMWSVALTDFMQMIMIVIGLVIISIFVAGKAGGAEVVIGHAAANNKFDFWPEFNFVGIMTFVGALVTMMLGSVPQQDVFQRVMSAKDEKTAVRGTVIGGSLYFLLAFFPIFITYSALLIDPAEARKLMESDSQMVLPTLIMNHTPVFIQIMFFGALLSAIMSTASGTLLAPSVTFAENIVKSMLPHLTDHQLLKLTRGCVVGFAGLILIFALNSELSIYEMVENAYKVTLAGAFVPLAFGIYWKRANTAGATLSIIFGVSTWIFLEFVAPEAAIPPQLGGLLAGIAGMLIGGMFGKQHHEHHHHHGHEGTAEENSQETRDS